MAEPLEARIAAALGTAVAELAPLAGGCIGRAFAVQLEDGRRLVAKTGGARAKLDIEGRMLAELRALSALPVPEPVHAAPDLLIMTRIEHDGGPITPAVEAHAAELLAALHGVEGPTFGFPFDTLIGGLDQPNGELDSWPAFFRERRLLHMARAARREGRIGGPLLARVERLGQDLPRLIPETACPALLHGDMWGGNVLVKDGRVAGFVDPACYFGDPEIELAFATLFSTFGEPFFARYAALRPFDAEGFFGLRRDLYNLYPLLVHARLFGGHYVAAVERTLQRLGY